MESDKSLVERVRSDARGDLRAFEQLVNRHQGFVHTNCRHMSGSSEEAEDLTQEVFVKAYFGLPRFEGRSNFGSWLKRIKVNHCLNHLRRKRGKQFVDVDDPVNECEQELQVAPGADRELESKEAQGRIRHVLAGLPDTLRLPLILRDLDGLSYREIAEELDLGLSAVKMRIKRGREEFRRRYSAPGESE
jgi:RNA polymerase sigma-70 factor, ECF subfamily